VRTLAVICNVFFWLFFCFVMWTDGSPVGADIPWSLFVLLLPICNILVIRVLSSTNRVVTLLAFVGNIAWLGLACWLFIDRYPSHPKEEGLIGFVVLMALTPLLSAVAIYLRSRVSEPALPK
jgi:hypothetical protein